MNFFIPDPYFIVKDYQFD